MFRLINVKLKKASFHSSSHLQVYHITLYIFCQILLQHSWFVNTWYSQWLSFVLRDALIFLLFSTHWLCWSSHTISFCWFVINACIEFLFIKILEGLVILWCMFASRKYLYVPFEGYWKIQGFKTQRVWQSNQKFMLGVWVFSGTVQ